MDQLIDSRRGYTWLYNDIVKDKRLSAHDKVVYLTLCMFANTNTNNCFPSQTTLCNTTGFSKPTIIKSVNQLVNVGYILVTDRENSSNVYHIVESPPSKNDLPTQLNRFTAPVNEIYTNNNHITKTKDNNKDISISDYVTETIEEDYDMQNKLLNILSPEAKKVRIFYAMATNDWSKVTATDYLKYMVGITGLWNGPEKRTVLPSSGKELNYIVGNFKKTFLEAYNLEGPRAIEAIAKFVENYPNACDQKYRDRIDPIIFTMPGVVDRIMKYEDKLKPTKREVSDEVF